MKKCLVLITVVIIFAVFAVGVNSGCVKKTVEKGVFYTAGVWDIPPAFHGNPWAPGGENVTNAYIYEPLFVYNPATKDFIPRLGEEFEESEDKYTLTVHLKDNVFWHDDAEFSAEDVRATFHLGYLKNWVVWKNLDSIECPDENTVVFHWKTVSPTNKIRALTRWINSSQYTFGEYSDLIPDIMASKLQARGEDQSQMKELMKKERKVREVLYRYRPEMPVGTGPYKIARVSASDITLEKYEDYYEAENVKINKIRIMRWASNEVVWSYLIAGEVDAVSPACPYDVAQEIKKRNPDVRIITPSDMSTFGLIFNCGSPMLTPDDIKDWDGFISMLTGDDKGRLITGNYFPRDLKIELGNVTKERPADFDMKIETVIALNYALRSEYFYDDELFTGVNLPGDAKKLLGKGIDNLSAEELQKFNRMAFNSLFKGLVKELPPEKPTHDLAFRQAVAHILDRDMIRKVAYYYGETINDYSLGLPASFRDRWLGDDFYDGLTVYDQDFEKAEKLLMDAGYTKDPGSGNWMNPDGSPVTIEIAAPQGLTDLILLGEAASAQLTKFGIPTQLRAISREVYMQTISSGNFEIAADNGAQLTKYGHPSISYNRFYCPGDFIETAASLPYVMNYKGGEVNTMELVYELNRVLDENEEERNEIVEKLAWVTNENLPYLACYEKRIMIFTTDGKRVTGWPEEDDPIWSAAPGGVENLYATMLAKGILEPAE